MGSLDGHQSQLGSPATIEASKITAHDPIDDVTSIPQEFKHRAVIRLLGAKLQHEETPCGLVDIMDALAYGEADDEHSTFLRESLEDPRVRPHRSKI